MVKVLGSLCVLAGGALAWWVQMAERRRRRDTLSDLLTALRRMGEEVRMTRTPLPRLLDTLSRGCGADAAAFFRSAAEAARRGADLEAAWRAGAEALPLSSEDRAVLAGLGKDLRGDEESVCRAVSLAACQLAKSAEDMAKRRRVEERQATALCFSAAALLVILLI